MTIISFTLESAILWIEERRNITKKSRLEWFTNDTFQLQRLAHEELGIGTWNGCTGPRAIPVTEKGELLAVLDATDLEHPRLMADRTKVADGKDASEIDPTHATAASEDAITDKSTEKFDKTIVVTEQQALSGDETPSSAGRSSERDLPENTIIAFAMEGTFRAGETPSPSSMSTVDGFDNNTPLNTREGLFSAAATRRLSSIGIRSGVSSLVSSL